ncbi:hypothetical protein [Bacillus xiapuensis]|uniref:BRE1-like coiled-coil containing domain-containing protein n=1 Tax=Bacillus xiapuensis TaxID=2014075 RepID=A0ABU6N7Y7_9BACI|nr:hypothetical protein [Bacillus xiapuensis]
MKRAILITSLLLLGGCSSQSVTNTNDDYETRISNLEQQNKELRSDLDEAIDKLDEIETNLDDTNTHIDDVESKLDDHIQAYD